MQTYRIAILGQWLVAATVRSLNHIMAMAEKSPDGTILSIQETRLTHLGIHLLCLITIFALDVLKLIPVPVLYGVSCHIFSLCSVHWPLTDKSLYLLFGIRYSSLWG